MIFQRLERIPIDQPAIRNLRQLLGQPFGGPDTVPRMLRPLPGGTMRRVAGQVRSENRTVLHLHHCHEENHSLAPRPTSVRMPIAVRRGFEPCASIREIGTTA
jgi:hypothetical protein